MIAESAEIQSPIPENRYNPEQFVRIASVPGLFREKLPVIVRDFRDMPVSEGNSSSDRVLRQMGEKMTNLYDNGSSTLLDSLIGIFAQRKGWVTQKVFGSISFPQSLKYDEFSEDQKREWHLSFDQPERPTGGVPREDAIKAFYDLRLIHFNSLPSVKHIDDSGVLDDLRMRISKVPFQASQ